MKQNKIISNKKASIISNKKASKLFTFLTIFAFIVLFNAFIVNAGNPELPVNLGTAGNFVILAKSGVTTTGTTAVTGDIGVSPIAATSMTGFGLILDPSTQFSTSSLVTGEIYAADYSPPTPSILTTAVSDMQTAYTDAQGRSTPDTTELGAGDISGLTLTPGLHKWGTGVLINAGSITGDANGVTLDCGGNANAVFIFQIAQGLTVGNGAKVTLIGSCNPDNIFWAVSQAVTLGTTSNFSGNILALNSGPTAIVLNTGAKLTGRALAQKAVTLNANTVILPDGVVPTDIFPPAITLNTLNNTWTNNNQTSLNFTFKDAKSATASCSLFINGIGYNASMTTNRNVATLITPNASLAEGTYNWNVNCTDLSSNVGTSTPRIINIDKTAPVVNLVNPTNNTWSTNAATIFNFNYTDVSIASCTLYVGGVAHGTNSSVTNNTNTNITANAALIQGNNSWYVNCTDLANNTGNSSTRVVLVDSIHPESLISNVNGVANGFGTNNTTLVINFTANDTNIINWTLSLYNSTWGSLQNWTANTNNLSTIETYNVTENGTYHVNLTVTDNATNVNTTSFTVYVDQSAPVINSLSIDGRTTTGAILTVNASDTYSGINNCTYTGAGSGSLSLSGGLYTAGLAGLTPRTTYTVNVTCYDKTGYSTSNTTSFTTLNNGRSGGSGGGGSSVTWPCGNWTICDSTGKQTRTCTQPYSNTTSTEKQSCKYVSTTPVDDTTVVPPKPKDTGSNTGSNTVTPDQNNNGATQNNTTPIVSPSEPKLSWWQRFLAWLSRLFGRK